MATGAAEQANFSPDVGIKLGEGTTVAQGGHVDADPESLPGRTRDPGGDYLVQVTQVSDRSGKPLEKPSPCRCKAWPLPRSWNSSRAKVAASEVGISPGRPRRRRSP